MRAYVIGGTRGLGRAVAEVLAYTGWSVDVFGKSEPEYLLRGVKYTRYNALSDEIPDIESDVSLVIYSAGFGRISRFSELRDYEISNGFRVNAETPALLINKCMSRLMSSEKFHMAVIGSVAGELPSPMFAAYASQKAALKSLCESVNAELIYDKYVNRVTYVAPGYMNGTGFYGGEYDFSELKSTAEMIIASTLNSETVLYTDSQTYMPVIARASENPSAFAQESMDYKLKSGRLSDKPSGVRGFLSGTFDLFHIGHLNLIERAKRYCDYLTVGVHPEGSSHKNKPIFIPLEERMRIIASIKCVDRVVVTLDEDDDMYFREPYDMLFVGSDYKGTERFNRYERELTPLGVKIVYFPYTDGTSSTRLRELINIKLEEKNDKV